MEMERTAACGARPYFLIFLWILFLWNNDVNGQIVSQHFDSLSSLTEFRDVNEPNKGQVNRINLKTVDVDGSEIFSLEEEEGNKYLRVHKQGRRTRHFDRTSDINNAPALVISFDFELISIEREGRIAGWYLGDQLGPNSFPPEKVEKWAEIGIFANPENNSFSLSNERENMSFQSHWSYSGKRRITIIANNCGDYQIYDDPAGGSTVIPDESVHVWVDEERQPLSTRPFLGESAQQINAVKFLLRNTTMNAVFHIDNLLITEFCMVPLPVELMEFIAMVQQDDVVLYWKTASEKNSSHFEVERSLDGTSFRKLGEIPSAENSHQVNSYSFTDYHAAGELAGSVYYRLKAVDLDGAFEYSPIRLVSLANRSFEVLNISPNPFREKIKLEVQGQEEQLVKIELLDQQGTFLIQQEQHLQPGVPELFVNGLDHLSPGVYFLRISSAGYNKNYRLIKL